MVAKEAHVVPSVRGLIVVSAGVNDSPVWWDKCWRRLGEHHLEIAAQLGRDFQKPWFGWKKDDSAAEDFDDMVYVEVVLRMVHPLYASHGERWIDTPLHNLRAAGIAASKSAPPAPPVTQTEFPKKYPLTTEWFLASEDKMHFLIVTQRPPRKSSPFIPAFDTSFEVSFKEDALSDKPGMLRPSLTKDRSPFASCTARLEPGVFIKGATIARATASSNIRSSAASFKSRLFLERALYKERISSLKVGRVFNGSALRHEATELCVEELHSRLAKVTEREVLTEPDGESWRTDPKEREDSVHALEQKTDRLEEAVRREATVARERLGSTASDIATRSKSTMAKTNGSGASLPQSSGTTLMVTSSITIEYRDVLREIPDPATQVQALKIVGG
ncbi:hypothetical protein K488DRAFT_86689 [Vararia minispora EC-137]|uniref:Uncharacterized protein n=1 Tax=Vararia minispora EC-137 TaxID=1314806 RepID=A0ACB8QIW3_9AGAM|nr:hypothetical protein K488DRAFT_86689 [Vararia minispora EC-137]